jgi:hypothetical protein
LKVRGFIDGDKYVACGEHLTLVLGQNDSGKSRLFDSLLRVLAPRPEDRWADAALPIVFVDLSEAEQRRLFKGTSNVNRDLDVISGSFGTNFEDEPYSADDLNYDGWDWVPSATEWLTASSSDLLGDSSDRLLRELLQSSVFALKPETSTWIFDHPPIRAFSVHWCIEKPEWLSLADEDGVKAAQELAESGFSLLSPEPIVSRFSGSDHHKSTTPSPDIQQVSDPTNSLPKPVVELGAISSLSQVLPISIPVGAGVVERIVESAVERMNASWMRVYDPGAKRTPAGVGSTWLESTPEEDGVARRPVQIKSQAVDAISAINREVNLQMPAFVGRKYEAVIGIRPMYEWDALGRVVVELRGIEGLPRIFSYDPGSEKTTVTDRFSEADLADGYRLWFQLAVLRAVQITCRAASELQRHSGISFDIPEFLGIDFYLVDEPERHLHAGLQRQAARWFAQLLNETGEQALVVSHSPAFISEVSETDSLVYVRDGRARNISRSELDAAHEPARDLGLTRGELLTLIRCLLVVEGLTDQAVLETLFGEQLRRAGVQVVPIHGHYRTSKAVIDVGSLLLRFTDATIAVWLDAVPGDFVDTLVRSPENAGDLRANAPTPEAGSMASLVELAPRHALRIEPIANPAADILFLLDEEAVRKVFPDYPGHRLAQAVKGDKSSDDRGSAWFRRLLGKEKAPGAYVDIANQMIRSSSEPHRALMELVSKCGQLAGSIEDRPEWLPPL